MIHNIPYVFEILIAESNEAPGFYFGVNHSPTFGDFLRSTLMFAGELKGFGIAGTLADLVDKEHVVVVHLIGIGLPFLDRGKSNLALPHAMKKSISEAVWCVSKVLYKERQKERRDAAKALRDHGARLKATDNNITMKEAVFKVMADAIQKATDNERLPANVRALYYKVRDVIQRHTNKPLDYGYFSQNLLIEYWQEFGRNPLIYNDPRGVLYAPHSEDVVQLGTLEVKQYAFPEHEYNKVLYIEKKGVWHTLKAAELHKKYDMAAIAGEGYASEAVRLLLEKAQVGRDCTIFVLHDADPDGYNIARTIQSETKRMPDHNIEVIDLGLSVQNAIEMGLSEESFTRKKQMAQGLKLNDVEQECFDGVLQVHGLKESWICKRIELNAMSARQLVDYVDQGIARSIAKNQLAKKVIPPELVQRDKAHKLFTEKLHATIDEVVAKHFYIHELKADLLENYIEIFEDQDFRISEYLAAHELETWDASIEIAVDDKLDEYKGAIERTVVAWIQEGA